MTAITSKTLVAFALGAFVSLAFFTNGCSRDEEPRATSAPPASNVSPSSGKNSTRLSDPEYKAALDGNLARQNELRAMQSRLAAALREKVNAVRTSLGTDDEAALKAELEKDPEFKSLQSRLSDVATALRDEQRHAAEVVRRKIMDGVEKSRAAEADAKEKP